MGKKQFANIIMHNTHKIIFKRILINFNEII